MQFLTHFVSFDIPEWMKLEQVDDCEQLSIFLNTEKWNVFSLGKDYLEFVAKYPMRNTVVYKYFVCLFLFDHPNKGENSYGRADQCYGYVSIRT